MKRVIIACMALLLAAPIANAGRKTKKTGKMDKGVYTDSKYDFTLTSLDTWSGKVEKEADDAMIRVIFTQDKPAIPANYLDAPHYTQTPRLVIWVDTSTMGIFPFLDSLLSDSYSSDQKKKVLNEFDILTQQEVIPTGRKGFEFGDERGVLWTGRAPYTKEVASSAAATGGRRVSGAYGGAIFGGKFGDKIFLAGLFCEYDFFDPILKDAGQIVSSLKWLNSESAEKEKDKKK